MYSPFEEPFISGAGGLDCQHTHQATTCRQEERPQGRYSQVSDGRGQGEGPNSRIRKIPEEFNLLVSKLIKNTILQN